MSRTTFSRNLAVALALLLVAGCSLGTNKARLLERAERYFNAGEYDSARIEYLNLLQADAENAIAIRQLGAIWSEQGAPMRALPYLLKSRDLDPNNLDIRLRLATAFLALGQRSEARTEAMAVLEQGSSPSSPTSDEAMLVLIDSARTEGDLEETIRAIGRLTQAPPAAEPAALQAPAANGGSGTDDLSDVPRGTGAKLEAAPSIVAEGGADKGAPSMGDAGRQKRQSPYFDLATARLLAVKGDLSGAEKAIEQALTSAPRSTSAHLALANLSWSRGDLARAEQEFKIAAELAPRRSSARLKYAEFKAKTGAAEEATLFLQEITREAPDFLPAWRALAQIAFRQKKYDESLAFLKNVFGRDPADLEAHLLQAEVWLGQGEVKRAVAGLERLSNAYPESPEIKHHLARAYLRDQNRTQATIVLNQAIKLNPDFVEATILLGELGLQTGDSESVIASMQRLLEKNPDLTQAQLLLAAAYRSSGRLDEAAAVFRQQISVSPQSSQPWLWLGLILCQQNKIAEAKEAFEKALELNPQQLVAVQQLVELDIRDKNFDSASRRVEQQLKRAPGSAGAHFLAGRIFAAQGNWDRAEAALLKTLELDPNFSSAYNLLLSTYLATNKLTNAIDQVHGMLSKKPDNVRLLMLSALIYERMSEFAKARDAYEKLLSTAPDFVPALNNLAYLYAVRLQELEKAGQLARKARALKPDDAAIADTLGWILHRQGDYEQALTLLEESAGKLLDNPEVQFHLGMAYYMMGQTEAAQRALHQAANAQMDFPGKGEIGQWLAMLADGSAGTVELSGEELEAILKQRPDDIVAWLRLAESREGRGAFAQAAAAYESAFKLNPRLAAAALKLAQLYAGPLENSEKGIEFAKKAIELAPNDPKATAILGRLAYKTGDFTRSYNLLQESARQLGDNGDVLRDLAWAAYSLGKVSEARQIMQRVLVGAPTDRDSTNAKTFLAMTGLNQSDPASVEQEVERLLEADPGYVPALMARAAIQVQRGESKPAIATYNEVLQRFPEFAPAQKRLASLYLEDPDNVAAARDLALKARKAFPDDPEAARILGEISYQSKDFAYARQLLQESAKGQPLGAKHLYFLGMSHWQLKEESACRDALERALAAGLPEPLATDAKGVLANLDQE
jgi:tetratricopeptide (TPR) repeat protein